MSSRVSRVLAGVLLAVLLVGAAPAPAVQAGEATIVFAAAQVLATRHVDRPDPVRLLAAAVGGLQRALERAGIGERLGDLTADDETLARSEFQARFDRSAELAAGRISEADLQYAAVRAMASSLGTSHTTFRDPAQWATVQRERAGVPTFSGIGTRSVVRDGRFYFIEVFPDGPAARAGVRPLDRVVAVDGVATDGWSSAEFSARARGPEGTTVTLTLQRAGVEGPVTAAVVRGPVVRPLVTAELLTGRTGYLRFTQFSGRSSARVRQALEELQAQGMRALVLDLRGNPGGLVVELQRIASLLLPEGLVIAVRESAGGDRVVDVATGGPVLAPSAPLAVLVDEGTGSAAEILAAALQEHGRGVVVGVTTAGAVLNSTEIALPHGTGIQVPVRRVQTARGAVLEGTGVRPDRVVVLTAADLDAGIDAQLRTASAAVRGADTATVRGPIVPARRTGVPALAAAQ
jgi:carboxyl-terminal processing protease